MKLFRKILSLLLILFLCFAGAGAETVVTSFYPIWLIARNLAWDVPGLEVINLAAPDTGCLHDYQLQTGDMKVLAEADLFLVNGAGMESYLSLIGDAFPHLPVTVCAEGIPLIYEDNALQIGDADEESGVANAHIWLSAKNAGLMAENMASAMIVSFPDLESPIQKNLEAFLLRMNALDDELKEGLSNLPRRGIITFHEAFPYFAKAYGLDVLAVVNREPGETLTAAQMAELADAVISLGLPPLFVEPQYEDLSARTLAKETGAEIYRLDPIVTGPEEDVPLDYYDQRMRQNMMTLREALGE